MAGKSLKNIDLNLLVIFEAIYSAGNISHAAKQLSLTQPTVSNALTRLRDLLSDPLFVRAGRGVKATSKAQRMIGPVRDALELIGQQLETGGEIELASYKRTFRLVIVDSLEPLLMPPILKLITAKAPHIAIESLPATHINFVNEIIAGTIDIAAFTFPVQAAGVIMKPLCTMDVVVISRRDHPAIRRKLDLPTFLSLGHVTFLPDTRGQTFVEKAMVDNGFKRRVVYMVSKMWSMPPIVERTDLIAMIPRRFAQEFSRNNRLTIHEPPFELVDQRCYLMWHERNDDEPGHKWLRERMFAAARAAFGPTGNAVRLNDPSLEHTQ